MIYCWKMKHIRSLLKTFKTKQVLHLFRASWNCQAVIWYKKSTSKKQALKLEALFHVLKPSWLTPFVPCPAALSSVLQLYNPQIYGKKNVKNWVRLVNPCNTTHWQITSFQGDLLCSCRVLVQNEFCCRYLQSLRTNHRLLGLATTDSEKNENIYLNLKVSVALLSSLHCL